jgi:hypothetical protein
VGDNSKIGKPYSDDAQNVPAKSAVRIADSATIIR